MPRAILVLLLSFAACCHAAAPVDPASLPGLELDPDELELLPLTHYEWQELHRAHRTVIDTLYGLRWHRQQLDKKEDKADWDTVALIALDQRAREGQATLLGLVSEWGVDARLLGEIARAPAGPRRTEGYARLVALRYGGLDERQRQLLAHVAHSIDAAERVMRQEEALLRERSTDQALVAGIAQEHGSRLWEINRRFWRLVDWVLDDQQRRAVRARLPRGMREIDDFAGHLQYIPGLVPEQEARLGAIVAEFEAESAADHALVRKLEKGKADPALAEDARKQLGEELGAGYQRLNAMRHRMSRAVSEVLDEGQRAYLEALPPRIYSGDRQQRPRELLAGIALSRVQLERIAALEVWQGEHDTRAYFRGQEMERQMAEAGPETPQMQSMQRMRNSEQSADRATLRELLGEVFLEALDAEQVVGWVLGPVE